jgi:glycine betaine/proline transport system substrate-binding protein
MKFMLRALAGAAGLALMAMQPAQAECGKITVADMNWASAEFAAYVDKFILENGYGCEIELIPGDTMPTSTSMMEKGEPDIAPELWINAVRTAIDRAVSEGRLVYAAEILKDGGEEGWWIPSYVAEAHPEIKTVGDALKHPELFKHPEDDSKGAFYGCPAGWNCEISNSNLFRANEGEAAGFELIDPGSAAGLDGSIAKAYERKQPWFGYYWAPTSIMGKYPMKKLDFGVPHDAAHWNECTAIEDCAAPKRNGWAKSEVYTVVTPKFAKSSPEGMAYIKQRGWSNSVANEVLAYMTDNQYTGEDGATYFLRKYENLWSRWVSPAAAAKIKAALTNS